MFSTLLDLVLPRPCPGCGGPSSWCDACAATLAVRPRRIRMPEGGNDALTLGAPAYALARYGGPVRAAILAGKEKGRRDLPPLLGRAFAAGLERLLTISVISEPVWLVPAPSKTSAARRRGGDPVTRMAIAAAQILDANGRQVAVSPCLTTAAGVRDSVGLDDIGRLANLQGRLKFRAAVAAPVGQSVLLLDDVLTTGATSVTAARVLADHGHQVRAVLVLAAVPSLV